MSVQDPLTSANAAEPALAVVVIGRNEAPNLRLSLESVRRAGLNAVYVDSGSTDGSPDIAREMNVPAIELNADRPLSAARGRNVGLSEAVRLWPQIKFVLFLDGDCVLDSSFPIAALRTLADDPDCAIVFGHLSEREPHKSVYNRLCSIEWRSPAGRLDNVKSLGGIMVIRVERFLQVGGFNEKAIAGEEPDLGIRLMLTGSSIIKIDHAMATHDARMYRFSQWWKRSVRAGHAMAYRYATHGQTRFREGFREIRSALFWGGALPFTIFVLLWATRGLSLILFGGYGVLGWRIYRHYRGSGLGASDSLLIARHLVYAKFAEVLGVLLYHINRAQGRFRTIDWR